MKLDYQLLCLWLILMILGVFAIYSASSTRIGDEVHVQSFYIRQIIWIAVSLIAVVLVLRTPNQIIDILVDPAYAVSLLMLIVVMFLPSTGGSHRWISLGLFKIQASEIAKLATILFVARHLSGPWMSEWKTFLRSLTGFGIPAILVLLEPDLGTSLVFMFTLLVVWISAGIQPIYVFLLASPVITLLTRVHVVVFIVFLLVMILVMYRQRFSFPYIGIALSLNMFIYLITPLIWSGMKPYQQSRILTFLDPTRDPLGAGYQIIQAKIAIGSGGVTGKGFLMGTQKNLEFLPEKHTDFIFSVIGEEFGFTGCFILIVLFAWMMMRMVHLAGRIKRKQYRIASYGILAYLFIQVFINVGMNMGIFPTTGIPLPFISYGGSSLLVNSLGIGLFLKFAGERVFTE